MKHPHIPENEAQRQQALDETGLLSSNAEARFDRITRLASDIFSVPVALVSLIDRDRQWFKSRQGLDATETPRDISFCGHAILNSTPLIIENALEDERFCDNPLVIGAPGIRFYAGMPLHVASGHRIGTLCLIDYKPRSFSEAEVVRLADLAGVVEELIQAETFHRNQSTFLEKQLQISHDEMTSLIDNMPGVTYRCLSDEHWTMLYISGQVDKLTGYSADDIIRNKRVSYAELIHHDDAQMVNEAVTKAVNENREWRIEYRLRHQTNGWRWVEERGKCIGDPLQDEVILEGFIVDITREHSVQAKFEQHQKALTLLNAIAFSTHNSLDEKIAYALQEARQYLKADIAILSQIEQEVCTIAWLSGAEDTTLKIGQQFALKDTWSHLLVNDSDMLIAREQFIAVADSPEFHHHNCYKIRPVGSYAGIVLEVDGHLWGTLNFSSSCARFDNYDDSEKLFLRLLASWLSDLLTNRLGQDRLAKLTALLPGTTYQFRLYPNGRMAFPFSSPQIERLYGITPAQAAKDAAQAFARIHPDDLEAINLSIEYSANTLKKWHTTFRVDCPEKGYRWISGQATPETMVDGSIMWHGYLHDIHEQHQSRLALERSEARLRGLFHFSPIGIALNDLKTGQFLDLNDALLSPTGYTRDEFTQLSYWDITPQKYELDEQNVLDQLQQTGRYGPFEKEYIRKDGSYYPVRLQGMLTRELDGTDVIWSLVEDITERKRLDKMKDGFIATVSHELRTPLTSIKGALGLLSGGVTGKLSEKADKLVNTAERNTSRLMLLINDLLDMEKLVAGKMPFSLQYQPLGPLLDDSIDSVLDYQHKQQVLIQKPEHWPDVTVNVDAARLIQALVNLLSNAIKFSPNGEQVEVSATQHNGTIEIGIRDHGPGVAVEFQGRLFQRFSQADSNDNRKLPGTGLGLAITREICQHMDCQVGYRDAEGGGSLFFIQLQIAKE